MAAHGEPQLEPQAEVQVTPAAEPVAMPAGPAFTAEAGIGTAAHVADGPGGLRAALAAASGGQRRKFVLQLQRTAGNAAVCRWLGIGRSAAAPQASAGDGEDWSDVEAWLAEANGDEEPPDTGGPRAR
ncbi:MAG: hypothetical protein QOE28_2665 [Solirubrobacteraceae bacterium]|jgi:hypothetical protein|nr:hypothetical protein [Solirubrobacteraceae bacterium]